MNFFTSSNLKKSRTIKQWISLREFRSYIVITYWLLGIKDISKSLIQFGDRIQILINKSGFNFAHLYLKECMRLTIRVLAGQPDKCMKIHVKVDVNGLPKILPYNLRKILLLKGGNLQSYRRKLIGILTLLSIFRVFPTSPKVKMNTITDEFKGSIRTFDKSIVISALKDMGFNRKSLTGRYNTSLIGGEAAGPNSRKSAWGSLIDALAFIHNPRPIFEFCLRTKSYWVICWLSIILMICGPLYYIIILLNKRKAILGRLSVVFDQAGKARVVAITNYWIQMCLFPLHKKLFSLLKRIDMDGTFDQEKPLKRLIFLHKMNSLMGSDKQLYHCFDLSAATDRLPLQIQIDILNQLGFCGNAWAKLLNIDWEYKTKSFRYSVGQPMGAYSSWAMLAITHHTIVKISALQVGISDFRDYGVLGDDVVIYNDKVADQYLINMKLLGVEINLNKSVQSYDFAEFAKKWVGHDCDISPLGPGLILQSIRDKTFISNAIFELLRRNVHSYSSMFDIIRASPKFIKVNMKEIMGGLFASCLRCYTPEQLNDLSKDKARNWLSGVCNNPEMDGSYMIREFFRYRTIKSLKTNISVGNDKISFLLRHCLTSSQVRNKEFQIFDTIFILLSPGFWNYLLSLNKTIVESETNLYLVSQQDLEWWLTYSYSMRWELLSHELMKMAGGSSSPSIDWNKPDEAKNARELAKDLQACFTNLSKTSVEQFRLLPEPR
uniref:RNA-dependent RNA polymerase n=1 Tax=Botrytis cinerea mitovirus 9 TaxID=2746653 RepID=A0A7D5BNM5_9VIRU|nr:RNA-dependent RNA polymerase [Botrytis cinerea mitovirus 9]